MQDRRSYCSACAETFARKFRFCPICGLEMTQADRPTTFGVTLVAEKNARQRNLLLACAAAMLTTGLAVSTVYSIFNKPLDIAELGGDDMIAFIDSLEPAPVEPPVKQKKGDAGNNPGGGGANESTPAQKGVAATQVDDPLFAPSKSYTKMTKPDLAIRAATQGNNRVPPSDLPYGVPESSSLDSDGMGCCGGQGEARDGRRGQGNEPGTGIGPGNVKNGQNGPDEVEAPELAKPKTGVTTALNIISKPRAIYTDKARENLTQGKVTLRVTFLSNGKIGPIETVSGQPDGLTEQAIIAARGIRFEPAKVNGQPVTVTRTVEYGFAIF